MHPGASGIEKRRLPTVMASGSPYVVRSPYGEITIPNFTIDQLVWQNVSKWEDMIAVECGTTGLAMTYKELRMKSNKLAKNLTSLGLSGQTVLIVLPNGLEYPVAVLGSLEAGITVSTANPLYSSAELAHQGKDTGAKAIVTAPDFLEKVCSANLGIPIICTGDKEQEGTFSYEKMTEYSSNIDLPSPEERLKCLALLPYSSGTTGLPKGVKLSHKNIVANLKQMTHPEICIIKETSGDHQDILPSVLPLFHSYGLVVIMLRGLTLGSKLITLPSFNAQLFLEILRNNKDIVLHAVPPIISFLANRPEVTPEHLEGLRCTMSAGAHCNTDDLENFYKKKSHAITQAYGLTEASPGLVFPRVSSKNKTEIGFPLSNTLGCIIDPANGKLLPPGQHGEICCKGPQVMEGYHNKPEATAETIDSDGWIHTGDIGYADEKGEIFVIDRIKELIKVKGFQVAPAELEALLKQHPSVLDAGVTSVPSAKYGEVPVAFVVPIIEKEFDTEQLLKWMEKRIAPYKKPAKVVIIAEIPKSQSGKILRRKLKAIAEDFKLN